MTTPIFNSCLAQHIQHLICLRQLSGSSYRSQAILLSYFDRFLVEESFSGPRITPAIIERYLQRLSHLSPGSRCNRFSVVKQLCVYLAQHEPKSYVPEPIRYKKNHTKHTPYIFSKEEVRALLESTTTLRPVNSLRPYTTRILLGLLYTTGIRIGEDFSLNLADFLYQNRTLHIREGKFRKERFVSLSQSACHALMSYIERRIDTPPDAPDAPLFINLRSHRLKHCWFYQIFRKLLAECGIPYSKHKGPRIHDLRHTFAVHRLVEWYHDGLDINARLPWLSTYMGHVDVASTQVYLQATPQLKKLVDDRFHEHYLRTVKPQGDAS